MLDPLAVCQTLERFRSGAVVIACQSAREPWFKSLRSSGLDIFFRGCMGKGSSLGLGLALARPELRIFVLDADGSLLMNLGSLATIAEQAPRNLYHFVFENGVYAGTGGQPIPGRGILSFSGIARAAGIASSFDFDDINDFNARIPTILEKPGPMFACLKTPLPASLSERRDSIPTLVESLSRVGAEIRQNASHPENS